MQDNDSVKSELQTLIMLEQQQASALHSINNKAGLGGMPGAGQFGMPGAGLYGPMYYGGGMGNDIGSAGFFKAGGDLYDRAVNGVVNSINNVNANMRNFAMTANLDSANPMWLNQSKLSTEARQLKVSRSGERLATGTMSALSGAVGLGTTFLASGIGGMLGGAALGAVVDVGVDQLKQNYAYDQYLLQNSHRFINMMESNNMRGVGGFSRNERWETANFLRHFNTEMKISDDDTMTILKGFTEGDLLRESKDVETFKKQMTSLTKSLKTMALTLNESYEEVAELMGEMKKKGIDTRNYEAYAAQSKVVGGLIGADAADTMQYQLNTASMLTSGTMMSTDRMMGTVGSAQAYMGKIYDEALANKGLSQEQELRYNRIVNRGGVDAATTDYLSATSDVLRSNELMNFYGTAFFDWDGENWNFNRQAFEEYTSGNYSMAQLQHISKTKLHNSGVAGTASWGTVGKELFENSLFDVSDRASLIKSWLDALKSTNNAYSNLGYADILRINGHLSGTDATFVSDITDLIAQDGGVYYDKIVSASIAQRMMDDLNSKRIGLGYSFKNSIGAAKDTIGDFFSPVGEGWNALSEKFQDFYYGKEYYDVKKLWSGIDFTKDYDFSDLISNLEKVANSSSKASEKLGSLVNSLKNVGAAANTGSTIMSSNNGINNFNWGQLTDWKSFKKNYSMWDKTSAQADYIQASLEAFNEAGGFGYTGSIDGMYSSWEKEEILRKSMLKYQQVMNDESVSLVDYNFAKAFEQYNLNIHRLDGFDDVYNSTLRLVSKKDYTGYEGTAGVAGKNLAFKLDEATSGYTTKDLENAIAEIEEMSIIEKEWSVAEQKIGKNKTGWIDMDNYTFVKNSDGTWDIASRSFKNRSQNRTKISRDAFTKELSANYALKTSAEKTINDFEAFRTGYTALAGMVGMSDADQRSINSLFNTNIENLGSARSTAEKILATQMFGELAGMQFRSAEDLAGKIAEQGWAGNIGGTQVVGRAVENWMSASSITAGTVLNEANLPELVRQVLGVTAGGAEMENAERTDREKAQADDIKGIRDILYHYIGPGRYDEGKVDTVNSETIFNDFKGDRATTNYNSGKEEVNISGNTGGNTPSSRLFR